MVLDTNIVIYAARSGGQTIWPWVEVPDVKFSIVTRIEAFGFPRITSAEEVAILGLLSSMEEAGLSDPIAVRAISLRRQRRMAIADAVIAATALEFGVPLITRNTADFRHIEGLRLIDPFASARH